MSIQGSRANKNGKKLKYEMFSYTMKTLNLVSVQDRNKHQLKNGHITMEARYKKAWSTKPGRIDVKFHFKKRHYLLECKYQSGSGSVAEKYPSCLFHARTLCDNETYLLLLDVYGGFDTEIIDFCKMEAEDYRKGYWQGKKKDIHVFASINEYKKWLNRL